MVGCDAWILISGGVTLLMEAFDCKGEADKFVLFNNIVLQLTQIGMIHVALGFSKASAGYGRLRPGPRGASFQSI